MKIKLFNKDVKMPKKSHLPDSGLDLFLPEDITVKPFETITLDLQIGFAIPEGFAGILVPRSSVAQKGLIIQTSIIDPDYTGSIHLIATNCNCFSLSFKKNDRICSICCFSVLNPYIEIVKDFGKTDRGSNGLGSSGE